MSKSENQCIKETIIFHVANDYDMDYDTAKYYIEKYPETYHEELENYIKDRANQN